MDGETQVAQNTESLMNPSDGTALKSLAGYSERELLEHGARMFFSRDHLEKLLRGMDKDIKALSDEFSRKSRMWGYTPLMFRKEIERRGLAKAD